MAIELKYYRTPDGVKTVLVDSEKGRKYLYVLMMSNGLVLKKVPMTEERYMSEVHEMKKRRSLRGAIRVFASYGRNVGASKEAKRFLREARS